MSPRKNLLKLPEKLECFNLGSLVNIEINKARKGSDIFVKKRPEQVGNILQMMPGLCSLTDFNQRFAMRVPTVISLRLRAQLVNLGLVSEKQLK